MDYSLLVGIHFSQGSQRFEKNKSCKLTSPDLHDISQSVELATKDAKVSEECEDYE